MSKHPEHPYENLKPLYQFLEIIVTQIEIILNIDIIIVLILSFSQ